MNKHSQNISIEFEKDVGELVELAFPDIRKLDVHFYGGTVEEGIEKARKQFNLGPEWKVINVTGKNQ